MTICKNWMWVGLRPLRLTVTLLDDGQTNRHKIRNLIHQGCCNSRITSVIATLTYAIDEKLTPNHPMRCISLVHEQLASIIGWLLGFQSTRLHYAAINNKKSNFKLKKCIYIWYNFGSGISPTIDTWRVSSSGMWRRVFSTDYTASHPRRWYSS
jgi:hypothetical protein